MTPSALWHIDPMVLATILAMAVATYATRTLGYAVMRRAKVGPFLEAWMRHVPGAVFMALVAPTVFRSGPEGWVGAAVTALAAFAFKAPLALSMAVGVATVAGLRYIGPTEGLILFS